MRPNAHDEWILLCIIQKVVHKLAVHQYCIACFTCAPLSVIADILDQDMCGHCILFGRYTTLKTPHTRGDCCF